MPYQKVEAGAGWQWIAQGWSLFTQSAGNWIVIALIFGILYFVLNFVPFIGGLIATLLTPALLGGMIYGARELDQGRSLEIAHLFQAFRESGRAGPMILLGLLPLIAAMISGALAVALFAGAAGTGMMTGSEDAAMGMMAGGGLAVLGIAILIGLVVGALLLFAVPRVMFAAAEPITALKESLQAVLGNIGAYIVFAVVYIVLAIIATIPFGLGFLVLIPVVAGAVYSANKQVFGEEAGAPAGNEPTEATQ